MSLRSWMLLCSVVLVSACGGGGSGGSNAGASDAKDEAGAPCDGQCNSPDSRLTRADVKRVLARAIDQAKALDVEATVAVVDRVGNVLAVHRMGETGPDVLISSTDPNTVNTGLDGLQIPSVIGDAVLAGDALAAISKALTGAYLSSEGNAFSTRTASQVIQENLNPGETNQPSGPLFGVQFSQLACSDFTRAFNGEGPGVGPQRAPLGLAADPGGFPLYMDGAPVGGVGVFADGLYTLDKSITDSDRDIDEQIALAATYDYAAPLDRRADRLTVEGKTLRFSDITFEDLAVSPEQAPEYDSIVEAGGLIAVPGYSEARIVAGTVFGLPESGIVPAEDSFREQDAFVFVDENGARRYPPVAGTDGADALSAEEVRRILTETLIIAERTRANIRRPLGTFGRVTISVVDTNGEILGMVRNRDAPVFGSDVSIQKARSTALLSSMDAGRYIRSITETADYVDIDPDEGVVVKEEVVLGEYVARAKAFIGPQALSDGTALTVRAIANLHRPFYPDGVEGNPAGPFSKEISTAEWSVFSTGLQLDLSFNRILAHALFAAGAGPDDVGDTCLAAEGKRLANGLQIFASSVPIYRGDKLIGGLGVAGDAPDQDEMMAFLGLHEAGLALEGSVNNAPPEMRADTVFAMGERLRYVQCPQSPFRDSDEQNVCENK